jgi:uncharacterized protein (TIGR02147 family)
LDQPIDDKIKKILETAMQRQLGGQAGLSVRALAKHLEVSSSYLSKIFLGKRKMSAKIFERMIAVLRLDHHEVQTLQKLVVKRFEEKISAATGVESVANENSASVVENFATLGRPDFWLLEKWYYLPILNLVTLSRFTVSAEAISERLPISPAVAKRALDELIEGGYLKINEEKLLERSAMKFRFPTDRSNASVRLYHQAMIEKSLAQLDRPSDFESRAISGITLAGNPAKVAQAKLLIEEALYRAAELLTEGEATEVFQINLQLFKLSK